MKHFTNLADYLDYVQLPRPEHPMLSVLSAKGEDFLQCPKESSPPITNEFYNISLKKIVKGNLNYGRTKYDFTNGAMIFLSPRQVLQWDSNFVVEQKGFSLTFHEDFIRGTALSKTIKKYGFFSYAVHEALHLSPKEEKLIWSILENIETEYHNNQDEFSKDIILSQLETLLKYADRFYKRQFLNRKEISNVLLDKFNMELRDFYASHQSTKLPNIDLIAEKLTVSKRYLSDTLKRETGKSTKEHINLFIVEKAKDRLLGSTDTVSTIAYDLGFEYPQYFSKMFKKQTGTSPKEYRLLN